MQVMGKKLIIISTLIVAIAACLLYISLNHANVVVAPAFIAQPGNTVFDKKKFSTDDPTSLWVIVNKKRPLPGNYSPTDLTDVSGGMVRIEASEALKSLLRDAAQQNVPMQVISAYRSYTEQQTTYSAFVQKDGVEKADNYSARPGFSEHQTGLAIDVGNGTCNLEICFADTPAGQWLSKNAHNYGFIIRYQQNLTQKTGYQYEPWHIRYVGNDLASELQKTGQTMEEFFGIPNAGGY